MTYYIFCVQLITVGFRTMIININAKNVVYRTS